MFGLVCTPAAIGAELQACRGNGVVGAKLFLGGWL
jgi:hypothetical protein